eukprot:scaffold6824_cov43-Attheya_sp.AAC.1
MTKLTFFMSTSVTFLLAYNSMSRDTLRLIVQERNDHLEGPNANNGGGDTQNNRPFNSSFNRNPRPNNRPTDNRARREPRPPAVIGQQYGANATNKLDIVILRAASFNPHTDSGT